MKTSDKLEKFCKDMRMSKTGATENAIVCMYMDKMRKAFKMIK